MYIQHEYSFDIDMGSSLLTDMTCQQRVDMAAGSLSEPMSLIYGLVMIQYHELYISPVHQVRGQRS